MTKHTILFLAANPLGTDRLNRLSVDGEAQAIREALQVRREEQFELVTRWPVHPVDLLRELRELRPAVIHFSGHGRAQLATAAVDETLGAAGSSVKLVVLSACYTEVQAETLLAYVPCVVGAGGGIRDDAARSFAIGFYGGLEAGESIATAYRLVSYSFQPDSALSTGQERSWRWTARRQECQECHARSVHVGTARK